MAPIEESAASAAEKSNLDRKKRKLIRSLNSDYSSGGFFIGENYVIRDK